MNLRRTLVNHQRGIIFGLGFLFFLFIAVSPVIWMNDIRTCSIFPDDKIMVEDDQDALTATQKQNTQPVQRTEPPVCTTGPVNLDDTDDKGVGKDKKNSEAISVETEPKASATKSKIAAAKPQEKVKAVDTKYYLKNTYVVNPEIPYKPLFVSLEKQMEVNITKDSDLSLLPEVPARSIIIDGIVGIENKGNSCYAESYIQALFRTPIFRKIIANFEIYRPVAIEKVKSSELILQEAEEQLNSYEGTDENVSRGLKSRFNVLRNDFLFMKEKILMIEGLNHLFHQLQNNPAGIPANFRTEKSDQCLQDKFHYNRQEDAYEFMNKVYEALTEFIPPVQVGLHIALKLEKSFKYLAKDPQKNPRHNTHVNTTNEVYGSLDLAIQKDPKDKDYTLETLLKEFFKVINDTEYKFDDEEGPVGTVEETPKLAALPDIIPIQIKRSFYDMYTDTSSKISTPVSMPDEIDFAPYCTSNFKGSTKYRLKMFVYHLGSTLNSGHYVTYTQEKDGNWYKLDDHEVIRLKSKRATNFSANGKRIFVNGEDGKIYEEKEITIKSKGKGKRSWKIERKCITDTGYIYFYERKSQ